MITRNIIEQSESLLWVSARTDIGMRRDSNEDSMLVADLAAGIASMSADMNVYDADERGMLMAISDGMGEQPPERWQVILLSPSFTMY